MILSYPGIFRILLIYIFDQRMILCVTQSLVIRIRTFVSVGIKLLSSMKELSCIFCILKEKTMLSR